ncbi:MAG: methyltransferase domain-containing protein [Desulfobacteraceae bacterium]|nr:methyltransferase domain-containing protein [Desulfobacteraceae bacterium]
MTAPYRDLYIYYLRGRLGNCLTAEFSNFLGNWEEDEYSFLFFSSPSMDAVESIVREQPEVSLIDHYRMSYEEWQGGPVVPLQVCGLTICPPWNADGTENSQRTIILDPGLVFGTGTHPTTRDCLEALELAMAEGAPDLALDIGTGTGLLALAAARYGCRRVIAVELNGLAATTANRNIRLNRLHDRIMVVQGDAEKFMDLPVDLMISNIHYDVMRHLVVSKGFLREKHFILSGLLRSEARQISRELERIQVSIIKTWQRDGVWHTFYGKTIPEC